jgi:hypothetical protein
VGSTPTESTNFQNKMNLKQLVEKGLWIKCFQNGNEIIPFNLENEKLWLEKNNKWSLVYKQK